MIHSSQVTENIYGRVASKLRKVLELTDALVFFPDTQLSARDLNAAREEYLIATRRADDDAIRFRLRTADWSSLTTFDLSVHPSDDHLRKALETRIDAVVSNPDSKGLLGPPLWPVAGLHNVVEVLVADRERVLQNVPEPYGEIGWTLGCSVEDLAWSAVWWSMKDDEAPNPYLPLLRIAASGAYLIGSEGRDWIFVNPSRAGQ